MVGKERIASPIDPRGGGTLDTAVAKEITEFVAGEDGTETCSRKVTVRAVGGVGCVALGVAAIPSGGVIGEGISGLGGAAARACAAVVLVELCRLRGGRSPC